MVNWSFGPLVCWSFGLPHLVGFVGEIGVAPRVFVGNCMPRTWLLSGAEVQVQRELKGRGVAVSFQHLGLIEGKRIES
jgi:hypothetical protein